ncbi:MAG TPA: peptidoglycan DD-metalloendopeptidase family protein [Candidatus Peribacterales bacterium]|nr:peptidoglycan DD-metalloendopeptidase family protein [Candidatus Peribacterales bacterium]
MRALQKIRTWIRLLCLTGFIVCALTPAYIPQSAFGSDVPENELMSDQFLLVEEGFVMKTASITEAGHRLAYTQGISHQVLDNESLNSIADLYGIAVDTIRWANDLSEKAVLHPGQTLIILPVDGVLHTVQRGQSLSKIAQLYDIDLRDIMAQNQLRDERIFASQQIIIPKGKPLIDPQARTAVIAAKTARGVEPEPPRPTPAPDATPPASFGLFQKPCDCVYTQQYRPGHYAADMAHNGGGPIFAAEDGIIIRADYGWNGGYGNVIEIDHGNGLVTLYAHNRTLHVREGNAVRRGDVIAEMGNTGRVYGVTGIHLHFEVIVNGVKKNPLPYLQ